MSLISSRSLSGVVSTLGGSFFASFSSCNAVSFDLLGVELVATLSFSVASLPFLTLLLVTFDPFASLGVEAFGEDVVTLLIVRVRHTVLGRIELFGVVNVSLLEGQGDTTALEIDVDNLDHNFLANGNNLIRYIYVALSQLGDVNETLNALFNAHKRTERNELGDLARHDLADSVGTGELAPRIFLSGLERQGNAFAIHINIEDLNSDFLANLDNLRR